MMGSKRAFRQRGAALVVSLIMLLLLTLLGVTSMGSSVMEERMAGNAVDRQMAFQAAEAALREAERFITLGTPQLAEDCTDGICTNPRYQTVSDWRTDPDHAVWASAQTLATPMGSDYVAQEPRFIIEDMCEFTPSGGVADSQRKYRITAVGYGGSSNARVMLEAAFVTDNHYGVGGACNCDDPSYCDSCPDIDCPTSASGGP